MRVLCIDTHPDDETLGCGGTLLRHGAEGDHLSWLSVTRADEAKWGWDYVEAKRHAIAATAAAFADLTPDVAYLNNSGDAHSDHAFAFHCAMAALKPFKTGAKVKRICAYETPSETDQATFMGKPAFQPDGCEEIKA